MKKLLPVLAIVFIAAIFSSCSKTYTCTCVISGYGAKDSILTVSYRGVNHNTASDNCNNTEAQGNTTGYIYACHL